MLQKACKKHSTLVQPKSQRQVRKRPPCWGPTGPTSRAVGPDCRGRSGQSGPDRLKTAGPDSTAAVLTSGPRCGDVPLRPNVGARPLTSQIRLLSQTVFGRSDASSCLMQGHIKTLQPSKPSRTTLSLWLGPLLASHASTTAFYTRAASAG